MNKNEFLSELRRKLKILKKEEIDDIISEYEDNIDEKVKSGISEEEAIKNFGDIDELVKEILAAYKISSEEYKDSIENDVKNFVTKISDFLKNFIASISNGTPEDILNVIFKVFALLILIMILRIPFSILKWIGIVILEIFPYPFDSGFILIWKFIVEIGYVIVSIMTFISNFNKSETNKKMVLKKDKPVIISDKKKEKKDNSFISTISSLLLICVKLFTIFFLLPFWGLLLFSIVLLGLGISFIFNGILFTGPILVVIGVIIGLISFIGLISKSIFRKEVK